jgi:DNA-binding transcriptional LysR family regulator
MGRLRKGTSAPMTLSFGDKVGDDIGTMSDQRAWEMKVFLRVAEAGSFSAAGREVGMTPSSAAKLVSRIERRLGVRLMVRSTRQLRLTAEGDAYRRRAASLVEELDALDSEIAGGATTPTGLIRINASVPFGRHCLLPLLPAFRRAHPGVQLDLTLTDDVVDLYAQRVDIAFRVGQLDDSRLLAVRLGAVRRRIVASPSYLAERGVPTAPRDLARHECLGFNFRRAAVVWPLRADGRLIDREVQGAIVANNGETVRHLALLGLGLARLAEFHVAGDLRTGRLVTVLDDAIADREEVHALYVGRKRAPARIRAFLDFMTPRLRAALA